MGKLSNDATLRRVLDEEAHESNAVVPLLLIEMRREEQVAKWRRHRGNVLIAQHHLPALRDLDAFVEKRAGIFAANDVFGRRRVHPQPDRHECDRQDHRPVGTWRLRRISETATPGEDDQRRYHRIERQQTAERILAERRQAQHDGDGPDRAQQNGPERALFSRQCRAQRPGCRQGFERKERRAGSQRRVPRGVRAASMGDRQCRPVYQRAQTTGSSGHNRAPVDRDGIPCG